MRVRKQVHDSKWQRSQCLGCKSIASGAEIDGRQTKPLCSFWTAWNLSRQQIADDRGIIGCSENQSKNCLGRSLPDRVHKLCFEASVNSKLYCEGAQAHLNFIWTPPKNLLFLVIIIFFNISPTYHAPLKEIRYIIYVIYLIYVPLFHFSSPWAGLKVSPPHTHTEQSRDRWR